jgi:hypothetical protein
VVLDSTDPSDASAPTDGARTIAAARVVTGDDRVSELSRMLAGDGASAHARKHAAELLGPRVGPRGAGKSAATPKAKAKR